jgi:solute carrier family 8 (sodium/calcium exchanger)
MMKEQENKTWAQQFKNACMLAPNINDEGDVEEIDGFEACLHFLSMGWKVLFALVPPARYGNGWPSFILSLTFIGLCTAIVG